MKINIVDFSGGGDGPVGLYLEGKLHTCGDEYHDRITDWIDGFLEGLKHAEVVCEIIKEDAPDRWQKSVMEDGKEVPKIWPPKRIKKS